ncbi:MAG: hypothetical protein AABN95_18450 [Acidobacteriota bacterium]
MKATSYNPPAGLKRFQQMAFSVGALFLAVLMVGYLTDRAQFFHSYVFAFSFWVGISVGSLALLMLQHLSGGGWGLVIRRVLEAATQTLPLMLVLFVPIVLGAHWIYSWTHEEEIAKHPVLALKTKYLNVPFFTVRAAIYFGIWILLAYLLTRWSTLQDQTAEGQYTKKMQMLSGPGMVLLVFTVTFGTIDWFMSLDPLWYSTIYGLIFVASWALSALAFVIAVLGRLSKEEPVSNFVAQSHFHDLGKLLLALVMLWTYFSFSQFLIIWSGNLPEEIHWYIPRTHGGWGVIALLVVVLHFAFPFLFLLSRSFKRDSGKLVMIAILILVMRLIDLFWTLAPSFPGGGHFHVSWMDIVAPIGIGGLWLAVFTWALSKRPLIPINDPQFESVLEQKHAHAGH